MLVLAHKAGDVTYIVDTTIVSSTSTNMSTPSEDCGLLLRRLFERLSVADETSSPSNATMSSHSAGTNDVNNFRAFLLWFGTIFAEMGQANPNTPWTSLVQPAIDQWDKFPQPVIEQFVQLAKFSTLEVSSNEERKSHVNARQAFLRHAIKTRGTGWLGTQIEFSLKLGKQIALCPSIVSQH